MKIDEFNQAAERVKLLEALQRVLDILQIIDPEQRKQSLPYEVVCPNDKRDWSDNSVVEDAVQEDLNYLSHYLLQSIWHVKVRLSGMDIEIDD